MNGFYLNGSSHTFSEKGRIYIESGLFVNRIFSVLHLEQPKNTGLLIAAQNHILLTIRFKMAEAEPFTPSL
jgi:hypothetical protein